MKKYTFIIMQTKVLRKPEIYLVIGWKMNQIFVTENRNVVIFMGKFSSHLTEDFPKIKVIFNPKTDCILQPLDFG